MKKEVVIISLSLVSVLVLMFFIFPKTGFVTKTINPAYLENLREKAKVECLQNSQCLENSECVGNVCLDKRKLIYAKILNFIAGQENWNSDSR